MFLFGQMQRPKPVVLMVSVDIVMVKAVAQGERRSDEGDVDGGGGGRYRCLVIVNTVQVLLCFLLMAFVQLWPCMSCKDGEIWWWFNILFRVQLDHLVGDTRNSWQIILDSSQRGAAARMLNGRAVFIVY